jgi:transcription antitermination factor NusG
MTVRYYALRARPQAEFKAAAKLKAMGDDDGSIKPYVPKETTRRRISAGKIREVERPVVPGLVFAGFIGPVPWATLTDLPEVSGFFCRAGVPVEIPGVASQRLRAIEAELAEMEAYWSKQRSPKIFREGDKVALKTGAFAGRLAEVRRARKDVLRVVLELLGSEREVIVGVESVEAAA